MYEGIFQLPDNVLSVTVEGEEVGLEPQDGRSFKWSLTTRRPTGTRHDCSNTKCRRSDKSGYVLEPFISNVINAKLAEKKFSIPCNGDEPLFKCGNSLKVTIKVVYA